jgi:hypothetical protein
LDEFQRPPQLFFANDSYQFLPKKQ